MPGDRTFFLFLSLLFHFCYFSSYGPYIDVSPHRQHIDMEKNAHVEIMYFWSCKIAGAEQHVCNDTICS
jgi:hypothetical protein